MALDGNYDKQVGGVSFGSFFKTNGAASNPITVDTGLKMHSTSGVDSFEFTTKTPEEAAEAEYVRNDNAMATVASPVREEEDAFMRDFFAPYLSNMSSAEIAATSQNTVVAFQGFDKVYKQLT